MSVSEEQMHSIRDEVDVLVYGCRSITVMNVVKRTSIKVIKS